MDNFFGILCEKNPFKVLISIFQLALLRKMYIPLR